MGDLTMYHCKIGCYFWNITTELQDVIRESSPLERFSHEYFSSQELQKDLAEQADLVIADFSGVDVEETLAHLSGVCKSGAEIILCMDAGEVDKLSPKVWESVVDVWKLPMSAAEAAARFCRWQQSYKLYKDLWLTQSYLDTTINSVPHLIWYKDKEGAHLKVNKSFCKAVNKTMEQIEGRGHYYIWDIEPEEYAKGEFICMESEYEVMQKQETCIFDENVKIGDEIRQFQTYKSPLFDLDGSVMGTVGVANDVTQERVYEQMIIHNANTDFLTGLYNRRYLYQCLEKMSAKAFVMYYIDLDNFKSVNDQYGHQAGDKALVLTKDILRKEMRGALLARIGGDEFLVVEKGAFTPEEIEAQRRKLQQCLDQEFASYKQFQTVSASIGTASKPADMNIDMDKLIEQADESMYREKKEKKRKLKR